jgi:hypothetical protein
MKASKFIVLVGGILGILAFFLPLVSVQRTDFTGTVSAFQLVKGLDTAQGAIDHASVQTPDELEARDSAKSGVGALKGIVIAIFVPAFLLAAIGALGVKRKKFGRVAGTFSLLLGAVGLGIAVLLKSAAEGDSGIGMTLLLVTGIAGVAGGLFALVKPDRGAAGAAQLGSVRLAA